MYIFTVYIKNKARKRKRPEKGFDRTYFKDSAKLRLLNVNIIQSLAI